MENLPSTHHNTYNSTEYRSYYYSDAESSRHPQQSLNGRIVSDQETETALQLLGLSQQQPVITSHFPVLRSPSPPPLPPPSPPRKNLLYLKMSKVDTLEHLLNHHNQLYHRSRTEKSFKRWSGHLRHSPGRRSADTENNNNSNENDNDNGNDNNANEHINRNDNTNDNNNNNNDNYSNNNKESIPSSSSSPSSSFSSFSSSSSSSSSPSSSPSSTSLSPSLPTSTMLPMPFSSAFTFSGNSNEKRRRRLSEDSDNSSIYSNSKINNNSSNSNNNNSLPDWNSIALSISEKMRVGDEVGIHALISQTLWSTIPAGEETRLSVADNAELALYTRKLTQASQSRPYRPPSPIPMSPQQQHHQQLLVDQQQQQRRRYSPPPPPLPILGLNYMNADADTGVRPPIFIAHNSPSRVKKKKSDPALASTQSDAISSYASAKPIITMNANNKKSKTYPCLFPNCGKLFSRLYNLKSHSRTHTNERPFPCELCVLAFSRNHDLKRHMKIHEGDKPYRCLGCEKAFTRLDALKRHKTNNRSRSSCVDTPLSYP